MKIKKDKIEKDKKMDKISKTNIELEILKKDKKRLLAEIANKQEQWKNEKLEIYKYSNQDLIEDLIEILNSFEISLSFKVKEKETKNFLKGVEMTQMLLEKKLEQYGLKKIIINIGDSFDEKNHEVLETKWKKELKENTILEIKQSGYKLHDRVLQPVKIILNKKTIEKKEIKK